MAAKKRQKRSWGDMLRGMFGFSDSRNWKLIFITATFFGLVTNFVFLLGCMSNSTQSIYLYRMSSVDLINATAQVSNVSTEALYSEVLPNHWYWGLSGVCAISDKSGTHCRRAFPPNMSVQDLISTALQNNFSDDNDNDIKAANQTLQAWTEALSSLPNHDSQQSKSNTMAKASAALGVLSMLIGFLLLALATILHLPLWTLYIIAFLDSMLLLGSGVLTIYSMNLGPRALVNEAGITYMKNERDMLGPGFYVLFAGVLIKLISIGVFFVIVFILVLLACFAIMACLGSVCEGDRERVDVYVYERRDPEED